MSPHDTTAADLALALTGKKRVAQTVEVFGRVANPPFEPMYDVLVTPEGAKRGEVFRVRKATVALLQAGTAPWELDLEPIEDEEADDEPDPDEEYWSRREAYEEAKADAYMDRRMDEGW